MNIIETPWPERVLVLNGLIRANLEEDFSEAEIAVAMMFRLPRRCDQWLASRVALKRLAVQRGICRESRACELERPFVVADGKNSGWYASVSHSGRYAAAAVSPQRIGVDIEVIRDVPERAGHFFLSESEAEAMRSCGVAHRLLHFWCAKEAAWKQRSHEFTTLKQLPLALVSAGHDRLIFDAVETIRLGELIVAVTRES